MTLTWNLDQYLNLTKETRQGQKDLPMTSCEQIVTALCFSQNMADLEKKKLRLALIANHCKVWHQNHHFKCSNERYVAVAQKFNQQPRPQIQ